MIRKTMFAFATVAAIAAAALIPTEASAGGGKGGGMGGSHHGHWGHGYGGGFGGIVGDRTELLAMGARLRQGICLLLNRIDSFSTCRGPGLATRDRGHPFVKRANDMQLASSPQKVRVARMDSCDPLLATHFLLEKQVEARRFISIASSALASLVGTCPAATRVKSSRASQSF
jgi:hypothetical protein